MADGRSVASGARVESGHPIWHGGIVKRNVPIGVTIVTLGVRVAVGQPIWHGVGVSVSVAKGVGVGGVAGVSVSVGQPSGTGEAAGQPSPVQGVGTMAGQSGGGVRESGMMVEVDKGTAVRVCNSAGVWLWLHSTQLKTAASTISAPTPTAVLKKSKKRLGAGLVLSRASTLSSATALGCCPSQRACMARARADVSAARLLAWARHSAHWARC